MVKKQDDEVKEKHHTNPHRRVMQVVEVEEEKPSEKYIPEPVAPIKEEVTINYPEETPDIKEEVVPVGQKEEHATPNKDIVSELFQSGGQSSVGYPDIDAKKSSSAISIFIWVIVIFVVVAAIGGGLVYFSQRGSGTEESTKELSSTATLPSKEKGVVTSTPTASPTPTVSKKEITVQIWNGSGKSGVASAMKKLLETKGYTVKETGNAPNFSYEKTEIQVKADKSSLLDTLKEDVGSEYIVGTAAATLETKASTDVRVIVGKE